MAFDRDVEVAVDFFEALVVGEFSEVESWAEEEDAEFFFGDAFLEQGECFVVFAECIVDDTKEMFRGRAFTAKFLERPDDSSGFVVSTCQPKEHALSGEVSGMIAEALGGGIGNL